MKTTQYITDKKGRKVSVVLPIKKYRRMLEDLEELNDLKAYDKAKSSKQEFIAAEEAFRYLDKKRSK